MVSSGIFASAFSSAFCCAVRRGKCPCSYVTSLITFPLFRSGPTSRNDTNNLQTLKTHGMRDQQQYAITGHANSFPAFFTVFYLVLNCDSKRVFKHLRSSLKTYPVFAQVTCRFVVIPLKACFHAILLHINVHTF